MERFAFFGTFADCGDGGAASAPQELSSPDDDDDIVVVVVEVRKRGRVEAGTFCCLFLLRFFEVVPCFLEPCGSCDIEHANNSSNTVAKRETLGRGEGGGGEGLRKKTHAPPGAGGEHVKKAREKSKQKRTRKTRQNEREKRTQGSTSHVEGGGGAGADEPGQVGGEKGGGEERGGRACTLARLGHPKLEILPLKFGTIREFFNRHQRAFRFMCAFLLCEWCTGCLQFKSWTRAVVERF